MFRSLLFLLIIIIGLDANCHILPTVEGAVPKVFDESFLPAEQLNSEFVELELLGKVKKIFPSRKPKSFGSKFSIFTRRSEKLDITFAKNEFRSENIYYGPFQFDLDEIIESSFDPKKRTIILIPGYTTDDRPGWILSAKNLWLQLEDVNVIMVTWKDGNGFPFSQAVANTAVLGRQITIFLYYLAELYNTSIKDQDFLDSIQIVGHSLGAPVAGYVGKDFAGKLGHIIGLDPAGPLYDNVPREHRLDRKDAQLVSVLHTNKGKMDVIAALKGMFVDKFSKLLAKDPKNSKIKKTDALAAGLVIENTGTLNNPWFGIDAQMGDIDYYANDGSNQPGCDDFMHVCDHTRVTELYKDLLSFAITRRDLIDVKEDWMDWTRKYKLFAFKADDYKDFLDGANLSSNCPLLLQTEDSLTEEAKKNCVLPIDVTSPAKKLIEELKNNYHIDLNNKEQYDSSAKYWFKTRDAAPFVGDHYLLKIRVDPFSSFWDEHCALVAEMTMINGEKVLAEVPTGSEMITSHDFNGFATTFLNPFGELAFVALNNILSESSNTDKTELPDKSLKLVKVLPYDLKLSISTTNPKHVFKPTNKDKKIEEEQIDYCRLNVIGLEVQPVVGSDKNLLGLFRGYERHQKMKLRSSPRNSKIREEKLPLGPNFLSVLSNLSLLTKNQKLVIRNA